MTKTLFKSAAFFLALILFPSITLAQSITMEVPEENVDINDTFIIEVTVTGGEGNGQLRIPGVDEFELLGQQDRRVMQSINGEDRVVSQLILEFQAEENGTYSVGPAQIEIGGENYRSAIKEITITGEKLFVNQAPQGRQGNQEDGNVTITENGSNGSDQSAKAGESLSEQKPWLWVVSLLLAGVLFHGVRKLRQWRHRHPDSGKSIDEQVGENQSKLYNDYDTGLFVYSDDMAKEDGVDKEEFQARVEQGATKIQALKDQMKKVVVGQKVLVRNLIIALLARGHILLEGVPGLAKTLSIETLAKTIGVDYGRVQFTPDLLPSDLVGSTLFNPKTAKFHVKKGPIFTNLLLADEINRAPAKVQSALLEAMAERQATIGDESFGLEEPFVVMATQNPLEQEGTYSLPEAQLDRFLLKTVIDYPSEEEEMEIIETMSRIDKPSVESVWEKSDVQELWKVIDEIYVSENIYTYVKNLVFATRNPEQFGCEHVAGYLEYGVSPRGSLALVAAAKVIACMEGRTYVLPEDIQEIAYDVMRHRILLSFEAVAEDVTTDTVIEEILATVPIVKDES